MPKVKISSFCGLSSRDDVHGALQLQSSIVQAVQQGWRPVTPLARGGQQPLVEPTSTLDKFTKQAPEHTWRFLQFQRNDISVREDGPPLPQQEVNEVVASSSSESVSSSDSSSSSSKLNKWNLTQLMKLLRHCIAPHGMSRCLNLGGVNLAVEELQLTGRQSLCGHPGCRKGWSAVGAL